MACCTSDASLRFSPAAKGAGRGCESCWLVKRLQRQAALLTCVEHQHAPPRARQHQRRTQARRPAACRATQSRALSCPAQQQRGWASGGGRRRLGQPAGARTGAAPGSPPTRTHPRRCSPTRPGGRAWPLSPARGLPQAWLRWSRAPRWLPAGCCPSRPRPRCSQLRSGGLQVGFGDRCSAPATAAPRRLCCDKIASHKLEQSTILLAERCCQTGRRQSGGGWRWPGHTHINAPRLVAAATRVCAIDYRESGTVSRKGGAQAGS